MLSYKYTLTFLFLTVYYILQYTIVYTVLVFYGQFVLTKKQYFIIAKLLKFNFIRFHILSTTRKARYLLVAANIFLANMCVGANMCIVNNAHATVYTLYMYTVSLSYTVGSLVI